MLGTWDLDDAFFESSEMEEALRRAEQDHAACEASASHPPASQPTTPPPMLPPLPPGLVLSRSAEWERVAAAHLRPGELMKVRAVAGAGKSTVLLDYMARRPDTPFLVLSYNASIAAELRIRVVAACPRGAMVSVRTAHSLAFSATEHIHRGKHKAEIRQARHMEKALGLPAGSVSQSLAAAAVVAVERFISSADDDLGPEHLEPASPVCSVPVASCSVLALARSLWCAMTDPLLVEVPLSHDGYTRADH